MNTFEVGGDNAQQYAMLAQAMAKGQLYLEEEPPQWLKDMEDPYDKGARDEAQKETGEPYLFDVAYHDGHYYVYFGVVPVLLFYLPFYLLTGANFPTAIGVLVMALLFILGATALLDRFARYHFRSVSLGVYLLLQIPLVFCCGIMYLVKFPTFYSLPIMCGLAFSVWGLYCWMRSRLAAHKCGWLFAGSLCMALVAGCRPQLLVLSLLAFPLFWRTYITERRLATRRGIVEFACLAAPYVLVAAGIMAYNYARFGSLTDFGANYNLTVNDMTKRGMNVGRLAPAFFTYFLQPPCMTGVFPFLQPALFETTYMGQTIKEVTFGGILACLPILWVLAFTRRILGMRARQAETRTIFGIIVVLVASGVLVALLDAELAGILQRYYADFSFMFLAAAVLLCFVVNEQLAERAALHDHDVFVDKLVGAARIVQQHRPFHALAGGWPRAGVAVVRREGDAAPVGGVDGLVAPRTRADGFACQLLVGDRRREHADEGQALLQHRAHGGVQFEAHRALVGGRHCRDEREERAVQVAFAVALEGVHDIGGGERRSVGEDGALAQGHLVFQVVYLNGRVGCQAALGPIGMHVQLVEPLEDVPAGREKDAGARADGVRIAPLVGHGGRERSGHAALRGHGLGGRVVVGRICRCGPGLDGLLHRAAGQRQRASGRQRRRPGHKGPPREGEVQHRKGSFFVFRSLLYRKLEQLEESP